VTVLVTGGAGFIGSHLVGRLLSEGEQVRVLDDLSTGREDNLDPRAELVLGDVADRGVVVEAMREVRLVFHQAAFRSVAGSIEQPLAADRSNVHGTLTVLQAALEAGVERVVCASSSSVYGGAAELPTPETAPLRPRSPYAVSKLAGEQYARVYTELHRLETVCLRYFNVFGPRQRPDSAYAAVIPLFVDALRTRRRPEVHGDGLQSRDFTYIDDVVEANLAAARAPAGPVAGRAFNIAPGTAHSLLDLLEVLGRIIGVEPDPLHVQPRAGDVRHSRADVEAARLALGFEAKFGFEEGLRRTVDWFAG
jgi:UDP-glucose 4-epimerase